MRNWNLVRRLSDDFDIFAFIFSPLADDPAQRKALEPFCEKVLVHRRDPVPPSEPWDLMPRGAQFLRFPEVAERLRDLVEQEQIDIVQLEYAEMGQYAPFLGSARTVLTELDLSFVTSRRRRSQGFHHRYGTDRDLWVDRSSWLKLYRYELRACESVDQVHLMSEADAEVLAPLMKDGASRLRVLPNGVDTTRFRPPEDGVRDRDVLFLGSFGHTPNLDAVEYLLEDIWPLVRLSRPDAGLTLAGAHPPDRIRRCHGHNGIRVLGTVEDTVEEFQRHRVLAAPIRVGSGTRLKILEAFAAGLPVVSTTVGVEGIDCTDGEHCLIADQPGALAKQLSEVLNNPDVGATLSRVARRLAVEHYDWDRTCDQIRACYGELLTAMPGDSAASVTAPEENRAKADISVVIPTLNGGSTLIAAIGAIRNQWVDRSVEILCVDSGSAAAELAALRRMGVRVIEVAPGRFNHGLTRDLGARQARGEVLVFINQDAVPVDRLWLHRLTAPLFRSGLYAAIQGGIRDVPDPKERFFWDSCGARFYFTSESKGWIERYGGIGFSTVNAAIRREVWRENPFGWAPIMEDKKWQRRVVEAGHAIGTCDAAAVHHTHNYDIRSLVRRCQSEGWGWRMVGERYRISDALRDMKRRWVIYDLLRGLRRGRVRSAAELFFPWLRPLSLYWGNRFSRGVTLG